MFPKKIKVQVIEQAYRWFLENVGSTEKKKKIKELDLEEGLEWRGWIQKAVYIIYHAFWYKIAWVFSLFLGIH